MQEKLRKLRVIAGLHKKMSMIFEPKPPGATSSQYGFVFGIANLAAFLSAPIFGRYGAKIGPKFLYNFGAFVQAFCGLAFGFLDLIPQVGAFLGLSYFLR